MSNTTPTSPMAAVKLLPCPFCGSDAHAAEHDAYNWMVYCVTCAGAIDPEFKSKADAITAWNRRASIEQPTSEAVRHEIRMVAPNGHIAPWNATSQQTFDKYLLNPDVGDGFLYEVRALYTAPSALPANPTDAQKLTTLREGLHKWGWCAEFGALAKEVLDGPAGAPVDERAADVSKLIELDDSALDTKDPYTRVFLLAEYWQREARKARAALQQPGLADGWQPIETAPRDKPILLWWRPIDENKIAECAVVGEVSSYELGSWWDGNRYQSLCFVAAWQPLPAAPSLKDKP